MKLNPLFPKIFVFDIPLLLISRLPINRSILEVEIFLIPAKTSSGSC